MCLSCLTRMCDVCTTRATFRVIAHSMAGWWVLRRACRTHVDSIREEVARFAGVRPDILDIPAPTIMTGGPQ